MTYADAVRQIAADYKRRITQYRQAETDCLAAHPDFAQNERELRDLLLRQAKGEKVDDARLKAVSAENDSLRNKLGLYPPVPRCTICGDTGRVNGRFCDCAVALSLRSRTDKTGIPLHSFEDVDFSVYGEQRELYEKLFADICTICTRYPANKKRCIVLTGGTGSGKTYLAGCAAQKVMERGLSVMALTAFAANNRFLKFHTTFDESKAGYLDPLLDCTLLVLDDLGTESILKNVTVEYLYQVINERNLAGKLTLVTTNLTPAQILSRYGERIYSRLFDKSLTYAKSLTGKDIRSAL